jgi:hypothetical protein
VSLSFHVRRALRAFFPTAPFKQRYTEKPGKRNGYYHAPSHNSGHFAGNSRNLPDPPRFDPKRIRPERFLQDFSALWRPRRDLRLPGMKAGGRYPSS